MEIYDIYQFCSKYLIYFYLFLTMQSFSPRYSGKKHVMTVAAAVVVCGTVLNLLDVLVLQHYTFLWYTGGIFLVGLVFVLWYYPAREQARILMEIIFVILLTGTRMLASNLLGIWGITLSSIAYGVIADLMSYVSLTALCLLIRHSRFEASELSAGEYLLLDAIGIANLLGLFLVGGSSLGTSGEREDLIVIVLMDLVILCTAVILYLVLFRYTVIRRQEREKEQIIEYMRMQEQYVQQVEEALAQYREIRHELKNSLFYIDELVKEQEYGKLEEYLKLRLCQQNSITDVVDTGRPVISALLNQKRAYANALGIRMEIQAQFPGNVAFGDLQLCSVLANLIDNAVQECREQQGGLIQVEIRQIKSYLSISVGNTTRENVLRRNPQLITTKADRGRHGIGLKVVRSIVEEYDGMMEVHMENEHFIRVNCMLSMTAGQLSA